MTKFFRLPVLVAGVVMLAEQASARVFQRHALKPRVSQNGQSLWGTLDAPSLDKLVRDDVSQEGSPWEKREDTGSIWENVPDTGAVREYDFTVTREVIAPDGYARESLLVNGQFPGPLIEANWGDKLIIHVHNNITGPEEGLALHTHGLLHRYHPWEDGVPSVSQCPIPPGSSYTYELTADQHGSSWYHSHYSTQYAGGMFGPMVIHGPPTEDYDIDVGPVMLSDHYHATYHEVLQTLMLPNLAGGGVFSQNNLINGKMFFDCSNVTIGDGAACFNDASISKFRFEKGKKHLLRLINTGSEGTQRFTIDGHTMKVISNDFVPVEPYEAKVVTLAVGQRSDVIIEANGELDSYWMRSNISSCNAALQPYALAAIYYDDADVEQKPQSNPYSIPDPMTCQNDDLSLSVPLRALPVPEPDMTIEIIYQYFFNASNIVQFTANNISFRGDSNRPTLLQVHDGNTTFPVDRNVQLTNDAKSVRVVAYNNMPEPHPMHLHGFNMYILAQGNPYEAYNGTIIRPENPQRRDTFVTQPYGYTVFQFDAGDNPGMWPFHCHIPLHSATGMFMQFLTGTSEVSAYDIPDKVHDTCTQWIGEGLPGGIDSGA